MPSVSKSEGMYTLIIRYTPLLNIYQCDFFLFQVVILAKSGAIMDAVSVLAAALIPKSPSFVKKLEFSQEVVRKINSLMTKTKNNK